MLNTVLSRVLWFVVLIWSKTMRFRTVNEELRRSMEAKGQNCIYAFWHGSLLVLLHAHADSGLVIPVSESKDGEFITNVIKHFGFETARGSSKRKGDKAMLALITEMRKGKYVGITVDGPRGPLHKVKKGALFLAAVSNAPVIPVATAVKHCWIPGRSWDKLIVPLPFTKGLVLLGEPMYVKDTSDEEVESCRKKLEEDLTKLTVTAQELLSAPKTNLTTDEHG